MATREQKYVQWFGQPVHITLTRTTRGYTWEVSIRGEDTEKAMAAIKSVDEDLRLRYGGTH